MGKQSKGRKRNKSSPGGKPSQKKSKKAIIDYIADSEGEDTDYFDTISDSESIRPVVVVTPPTTNSKEQSPTDTEMAKLVLSQEDICDLCAKLAPSLIKEIKSALRDEIFKDLKCEIQEVIRKENESLRAEVSRLNEKTVRLDTEVGTLKTTIRQIYLDHDELAQYGRRMNLDISNIPNDTGSPDENVRSKFIQQARTANIDLKESDIDKCHRKGKPKPNINRKVIVKFTNSGSRDRVYMARKTLGTGIYVQENLTPHRESMGYEARKLKREKFVTKTWIAGCKVRVQLQDESVITIRDMYDIDEIRGS